jgi:hypothetical protein
VVRQWFADFTPDTILPTPNPRGLPIREVYVRKFIVLATSAATIATGGVLMPMLATEALSQTMNANQCVGASFPGTNRITLTNTCSFRIGAFWTDDNGRKRTILEPGQSDTNNYTGRVTWSGQRCDRGC